MSLQLCLCVHQLERWSRHPALTRETHTWGGGGAVKERGTERGSEKENELVERE